MNNEELKKLWSKIPIGEENGISIKKLSRFGMWSGRQIRRNIEQMIYIGLPVCNLRKGYFRPENEHEIGAYLNIINSYKCKLMKKEYRLISAKNNFHKVNALYDNENG